MKIAITIPSLGVTAKGWEKSKEIYVLGLAADLNPEARTGGDECVGALDETLAVALPRRRGLGALKWVVASASNVFHWVRPDQPPSLSGSGIVLYPSLDPKGFLSLHLSIVESDAGARRAGPVLQGTLGHKAVTGAVAKTQASEPGVASLMRAMTGVVPEILKGNQDDLLFSHGHSGFEWDGYRLEGDSSKDFEVGNDPAYCTLRVRQTS